MSTGPAPRPINHGTYGGSLTHYKRGEKPCEDCRLARNAYMRGHRPPPTRAVDPIIDMFPKGRALGVYVLLAADDTILYIGRTGDPRNRMRQHKSTKDWWEDVTKIEWSPCASMQEVREVEKAMIATFRPEANVADIYNIEPARRPLPSWVGEKLRHLYNDGEEATLDNYIRALRDAGWTLQSIAAELGMTRERVRQRQVRAKKADATLGVPAVPKRTPKEKKVRPQIPTKDLLELKRLQPLAMSVRGWTPEDAPERVASERYSELLAQQHLNGVSVYRIAKSMGVTHLAIRARLARHGYMGEVKGLDQPKYGTPWAGHQKQSHCKYGHPLEGDNLYLVRDDPNNRQCRTCAQRRGREAYQRRVGQGIDEPTTYEIRSWARANGYDVSATGRIPADVRAAFDAQQVAS